jgi:hypothetical protein
VGSRTLAKIDRLEGAVARIELAENAGPLAGEPDGAVGRRRNIVQADAGRDRLIFDAERTFPPESGATERRDREDCGGRGEKLAAIHCVVPALGVCGRTRRSTLIEHNPTMSAGQARSAE